MSKKCTPLWREAHFEVKTHKTHHVRTTFGRSELVSRGRRKGLRTFSKVSKTWGFCSIAKNDGRRGTSAKDLQRCIFLWQAQYKRHFHRSCSEVRALISWEGLHFGADSGSTSYDLAWLFRGRRNSLDRWAGKIAKRIGTRPSALQSTFHFWRKSRRIASFLTLLSSKIEEVSQNCFVFDVVNFKKWGGLAELLRFWCGQLQKMRKSCRSAAFLMLSTWKNEVS